MSSDNNFKRTTVYIPKKLHDEAKIMAVLTHSSISHIICVALKEKIKNLKENTNGTSSNKS